MKINESQESEELRVGLRSGYRRFVLKSGCISEPPRRFTKKTQKTSLHTHISQDGGDLYLYMGEAMGIRAGV